ncbi:uncharacterized protein K441DRAFT_306114 [Cenococcum geophilum 1.58]|uniref:uncharacterized protein n=1 Tax=Cenococcum geophilum 1.58 TaxID=794803 RepID=UPI00358FBFEC|nr:hypothetical protein K441DRAFT_306114 [Cenococcum geophilum 1.58]
MSLCLDYSVRLWVTISSPSPSPSSNPHRYYKFTATRIYVLTSISALRAFRVYAITSISVPPSLSRVNIRNTPRGYIFFSSPLFSPLPSALFSARDEH